MYRLGTSTGRLDRLYSRNQLDVCRDRHLTEDEVPDVEIRQPSGKRRGTRVVERDRVF